MKPVHATTIDYFKQKLTGAQSFLFRIDIVEKHKGDLWSERHFPEYIAERLGCKLPDEAVLVLKQFTVDIVYVKNVFFNGFEQVLETKREEAEHSI
jgi:hypothetical protein